VVEVMVMHPWVVEDVIVGPEDVDELVLTVVEQEVEVEEEEGEDVLELEVELVNHAEPVSMIARTVASVENFIADQFSFFLSICISRKPSNAQSCKRVCVYANKQRRVQLGGTSPH
jgi:hypothetical protein